MSELFFLSAITLTAMASPGPDMLLLARNGMSHGRSVGFATVVGICLALCIHVALSVAGLAWLIAQNIYVYESLKLLGALFLIYLGITALRSKGDFSFSLNGELGAKPMRKGVQDGFFCNLLNPKVTLFILSIFTQFISAEDSLSFRTGCGAVIVLTSLVGWSAFILILQSAPFRAGVQKLSGTLDRVFGGLMIAIGLQVALGDR